MAIWRCLHAEEGDIHLKKWCVFQHLSESLTTLKIILQLSAHEGNWREDSHRFLYASIEIDQFTHVFSCQISILIISWSTMCIEWVWVSLTEYFHNLRVCPFLYLLIACHTPHRPSHTRRCRIVTWTYGIFLQWDINMNRTGEHESVHFLSDILIWQTVFGLQFQ